MADDSKELQQLKRCVVGFAREVEYQNTLLIYLEREMEKKDAQIEQAMEENGRLKQQIEKLRSDMENQIEERSNFAATEEMESLKQEIEKLRHDMENQHKLQRKEFDDCQSNAKSQLKELQDENGVMKDEMQVLIYRERMCNDELQDARKEAIKVLSTQELKSYKRTTVGVRIMGQVDRKPFQALCSNHSDGEAKAAQHCSLWEGNVNNPQWHPFKIVDVHGRLTEIVDEDDEKLKVMRNEYGEDVYRAVSDSLVELNEYNPSGRYPIEELWNFKEGRRAPLKEIVEYIAMRLRNFRSKRKRSSS